MNNKSLFPYLVPALGIPAVILRHLLYASAVDDKGLLAAFHPLEIALWAVTVCAGVCAVLAARRAGEAASPAGIPAAVGAFLFACGIAATILPNPASADRLFRYERILGACAAVSLALSGIDGIRGKKPFYGLYVITTVYLAVHMLTFYRTWSSDPQLQDYVFSIGAVVCLTLFSYGRAALGVGMGKPKQLHFCAAAGAYFCLAAIEMSEAPLLLAGGCAWLVTSLCSVNSEISER